MRRYSGIEQLRKLLEQAVVETQFDMGNQRISDNESGITFSRNPDEIISSTDFRSVIGKMRRDEDLSLQVPSVSMIIPDEILSSLLELLYIVLKFI